MEEKLLETTQKYRGIYLNILGQTITNLEKEIVRTIEKMGKSDSELLTKTAIASILDEMMAANALVSALKHGGRAKSIILISSEGQAYDLLDIKELKQEEIFNQILDNHQFKK